MATPVDMFGIPMCARRASPRIRPSRLGPSSSISSQTRATSSTSSVWPVRVSGRMDFIPTKTSYLFAFKWSSQACTLSELAEEAGQTRCSALGGSPSHPAPASGGSGRSRRDRRVRTVRGRTHPGSCRDRILTAPAAARPDLRQGQREYPVSGTSDRSGPRSRTG